MRWDILTIGNLSRNRFWGESDDRGVRPPLCTSTLLRAAGLCLLVDPPHAEPDAMARTLDRRTGLRLDDVTDVFLTHEHADHWFGLAHVTKARWLASGSVAEKVNAAADLPRRVEPAGPRIGEAIEVLATPGHTADHHSLAFACDGLEVVVAGDAVMTRDFFADRRGFHNSADFARAAETIDELARRADILVPGHDNYFLTARGRANAPAGGKDTD